MALSVPKMLDHGLAHLPLPQKVGLFWQPRVMRVGHWLLESQKMTGCQGGESIWVVAGCG